MKKMVRTGISLGLTSLIFSLSSCNLSDIFDDWFNEPVATNKFIVDEARIYNTSIAGSMPSSLIFLEPSTDSFTMSVSGPTTINKVIEWNLSCDDSYLNPFDYVNLVTSNQSSICVVNCKKIADITINLTASSTDGVFSKTTTLDFINTKFSYDNKPEINNTDISNYTFGDLFNWYLNDSTYKKANGSVEKKVIIDELSVNFFNSNDKVIKLTSTNLIDRNVYDYFVDNYKSFGYKKPMDCILAIVNNNAITIDVSFKYQYVGSSKTIELGSEKISKFDVITSFNFDEKLKVSGIE